MGHRPRLLSRITVPISLILESAINCLPARQSGSLHASFCDTTPQTAWRPANYHCNRDSRGASAHLPRKWRLADEVRAVNQSRGRRNAQKLEDGPVASPHPLLVQDAGLDLTWVLLEISSAG